MFLARGYRKVSGTSLSLSDRCQLQPTTISAVAKPTKQFTINESYSGAHSHELPRAPPTFPRTEGSDQLPFCNNAIRVPRCILLIFLATSDRMADRTYEGVRYSSLRESLLYSLRKPSV